MLLLAVPAAVIVAPSGEGPYDVPPTNLQNKDSCTTHEGKFYVQRGARVVEPAPTEIVRATAINFGDWEGTPEYHRFQERVATVFPAEDDRQIATDDIINNVRTLSV